MGKDQTVQIIEVWHCLILLFEWAHIQITSTYYYREWFISNQIIHIIYNLSWLNRFSCMGQGNHYKKDDYSNFTLMDIN